MARTTMRCQLAVDDSAVMVGTIRQATGAVAGLVTTWLAEDPEGLALDAQMTNMAFTTGAVAAGLREAGEWSTHFGVGTQHAHRVKVTRA